MNNSRHKESDPATAAVERLLLVTLALEETLRGEDFAESSALFQERDTVLHDLSALVLTPKARVSIERVQAVERRIVSFLADWRAAAVREFGEGRQGRRATTAYLSAVGGAAFSMDGRH